MEIKLFEVRDRGTFIPCFGIKLDPRDEAERYLVARSGFTVLSGDPEMILFGSLPQPSVQWDIFEWGGSRPMQAAHDYAAENWDRLETGDIIDVEYIKGETTEPKVSERITAPL